MGKVKKLDQRGARKLIDELYEDPKFKKARTAFFNSAYRQWPEYNDMGDDTDNATEFLMTEFLEHWKLVEEDYDAKSWEYVIDALYESVYAALT